MLLGRHNGSAIVNRSGLVLDVIDHPDTDDACAVDDDVTDDDSDDNHDDEIR